MFCRPIPLPSLVDPAVTVEGCVSMLRSFIQDNISLYYNVYYCFRVIFIHLAPCSVLVVLNALLVMTIRQAQRRRRQLLAQNRKSESRRLAESNVTTMMLVAVVGVFLLVEFPLAILVIVLMVDNTFDLDLLDSRRRDMYEQLVNMFILLSYPINFFIYCGMSQQFRDTFCGLFARGGGRGGGSCLAGSQPTQTIVTEDHLPPASSRTVAKHAAGDAQPTYIQMIQDDLLEEDRDTEAVANAAV